MAVGTVHTITTAEDMGHFPGSSISLSHNVWATGYHPDDRRPRSGLSRADSGLITDDVRADPTLTPRVAVFGDIYPLQPSWPSQPEPPTRPRHRVRRGQRGLRGGSRVEFGDQGSPPGKQIVQDGAQARPASYDIMMHQPCAGKNRCKVLRMDTLAETSLKSRQGCGCGCGCWCGESTGRRN